FVAASDIVLVADRSQKPVADVAATYFAAGAYFQLDRIAAAARGIKVSDYFDRLALDRAVDSIGDAERRIAAEMMTNGAAGAGACGFPLPARPRRRGRERDSERGRERDSERGRGGDSSPARCDNDRHPSRPQPRYAPPQGALGREAAAPSITILGSMWET